MAVKKIQNLSCPFCDSTEFVKGKRSDGLYYRPFIVPLKRVKKHTSFFTLQSYTQITICVFCKQCGSLVREYIRNPELLEK